MSLDTPNHIAIIMDGNRRWAKSRLLPKEMGHKSGAKNAKDIALYAKEMGLRFLTLYTFSSENWSRAPSEIKSLMDLLRVYLKNEISALHKEGIRVIFIGDQSLLDDDICQMMNDISSHNIDAEFTLILAISYGGREEILQAALKIAKKYQENQNLKIDESLMSESLYTADIPDPELIIRTGGEHRISNFLLWQSAYSELCFCDVLWPNFSRQNFLNTIKEYNTRERRYGK